MNTNTSKLATTAIFIAATANGATVPFADIFAALAAPSGKPTSQKIVEALPKSKEDSPHVKGNELYGRGWDASWSAWAGDSKEQWNTGMEVSFNVEVALTWTAPLWSEYITSYE